MTAAKWSLYAGIAGVVFSKSTWCRVAFEGVPSRNDCGIEAIVCLQLCWFCVVWPWRKVLYQLLSHNLVLACSSALKLHNLILCSIA